MKKPQSLILFFICLLSSTILAQNTDPAWTGVFQGTGDNSDRFNKVISDGLGNFIGVGFTVRPGNYRDFLTVKFDTNGDTLWWKTKNGKGNGNDEAISAGTDASGNVFVVGFSDEDLRQDDIRIIKYDPNGNLLWDTLWNSLASLEDIPVDLKIDGNGNCIVGGVVKTDTTSGSKDYITLKYDPNGALIWSQQYSNPFAVNGKDDLTALTLDVIGDVYVTGRSFNNSNDDFVTIKYEGIAGTQTWLRTYDAGKDDRAVAMVTDNAGNIIVTGESDNGNNYDYRTIKYDTSGNFVWTKFYNGPSDQDDFPFALAVDAVDNVIITGVNDVDLGPNINFDFQTIKYSAIGTPLWAARIGNSVPQNDQPNSLALDGSGNIFITGKTDQNISPIQSDNDIMTVMYNSSGNIQWSGPKYHAGGRFEADDNSFSVINNLGNIYVAGNLVNDSSQKDAAVIKIDVLTGDDVWVKSYNGEGDFNESIKSIVIDSNNNSYVAGYTFVENNNTNACLAKLDPNGLILCTYQYEGIKGDDDEFNSIAISTNGNIYAAGYTKVIGEKSNMLLVKWNPATCDTIWTWTGDYFKQSDRAVSIILDVAGNIFLTGRSDANPVDTSENNNIITIKFDSNGNILWFNSFDGVAGLKDEPTKIILDNNGDVIVGGLTENIHDDDFLVLKYNSITGLPVWGSPIIWGAQYTNDDRVNDIAVDEFNNIFIGGYAQQASGDAAQDAILLKYNAAGNYLSGTFIIGSDKDETVKIAIDINNSVYILYKFDVNPDPLFNNYDFLLKKFNNYLDTLIYERQYDSPINGDDFPSGLIIGSSGDVYITGSSENDTSAGRVNKNWITLGYDDSGAQIFISNYDGPKATDDSPNALIIRGNFLWVCGNSEGTGNNQKDFTVNNYNLTDVSISEFKSTSSVSVFPNPFHNEAELIIDNSNLKFPAYLEIYDMLGNSVVAPQLIHEKSISIHRGNLSPGIYEFVVRSNASLLSRGKLIIN